MLGYIGSRAVTTEATDRTKVSSESSEDTRGCCFSWATN